ncbi:CDP-alcohol phosphatidyltransferase family protein [Candidatus Bathyarchaeota archaeon]|nr:CDP-alcohol phosphatidyltransferase family protein [Candidatus Bathyarchaeota archaeon]RJS74364.1 MAG: CDP-alcohol phosphatidyltransferase family protein [Candidatus Bathyarchaeota archaeon]
MLNRIRAEVEKRILVLAKILAAAGFKPEALSLMGLASAFLSALAYNLGDGILSLYTASLLVIASGFFDMVDGAVARLTGRVSLRGSFLDSTIDRLADALIIGGLTLSGRVYIPVGVVALAGSLLTSYIRAKAESVGVEMSGIGLAERGERLIILAVSGFLNAVDIGVWVLAVLSSVTVLQRILHGYKSLR